MKQTIGNNRIRYIDIARGLAMICIVLGHLGDWQIDRVVFTFHLPIFYLISGYYLNTTGPEIVFLKRKAKALLQPYYVTCFLVIALATFFAWYFHNDWFTILKRWIKAALYGSGVYWEKPFTIYAIGAIWFLWATFWGEVVLRLLVRYAGPVVRIGVVFGSLILSIYSAKWIWLPLSIQAGGVAMLFMYIGWLLHENHDTIADLMDREVTVFLTVASCFMWWWFVRNFAGFGLVQAHIGNGAAGIVGSLCGCWLLLIVSKGIDRIPGVSNAIAYLGRFSLIFLSMHLVELNTFPWGVAYSYISRYITLNERGFLIFGKLVWIMGMTCLLSRIRIVRRLYGYKN